MAGLTVEGGGTKWKVVGGSEGWIFTKSFPRKWKAEVAARVFQEGGGYRDYWAAARVEKRKRDERAMDGSRGIFAHQEKAIARLGVDAPIPDGATAWITRHPGDWRCAAVPPDSLRDFHIREMSGGVNRKSRPMLYARIWCSSINADEFGHSCRHGPPPHEILVCIPKTGNDRDLWRRLLTRA